MQRVNGTFLRFCGVLPCTMIGPHYWCLSERPTHQLLFCLVKVLKSTKAFIYKLSLEHDFPKYIYIYTWLNKIHIYIYNYIYLHTHTRTTGQERERERESIYSMLEARCHCIHPSGRNHAHLKPQLPQVLNGFPHEYPESTTTVSFIEELTAA